MSFTITNSAPVFSAIPLASTTLYVGETKTSYLPSFNDAEGHSVTLTYVIPKSFIVFDSTLFAFNIITPSISDIGTHTVSV